MKRVYKYEVPFEDEFSLNLPKGAQILSFQSQVSASGLQELPVIWVLVDPSLKQEETRFFRMAGTGHPIEGDFGAFIGTAQFLGARLTFHLFERPR